MSKMLERTIEAIRLAEKAWWDANDDPAENLQETLARAAMEAIREPTENMCFEGAKIGGQECSMGDARHIWVAMIDAALHHS